jgi:hypothetical protein
METFCEKSLGMVQVSLLDGYMSQETERLGKPPLVADLSTKLEGLL